MQEGSLSFSKGARRKVCAVALFAAMSLPLTGCEGAKGSTGEVVRLVITPVASPTATSPAQPTAAPVTYAVKEGDTLSGIADLFGVGVDDIVRVNNIADPNSLTVGQKLTIPVRAEGGEATSTVEVGGTPGTPQEVRTPNPAATGQPALPPPDVTPPQGPTPPEQPADDPSGVGPSESPTAEP